MSDSPAQGTLRRFIDKVIYYGCSSTEIDRRNVRHLNIVAFAWAVSYCLATYFLRGDFNLPGALSSAMILAVVALGAAMLWTYVRFLRGCDEMMRQLHLEALAFGFGITVLAAITWALLEAAGREALKSNSIIAIAAFSYMFGVVLGMRRYR